MPSSFADFLSTQLAELEHRLSSEHERILKLRLVSAEGDSISALFASSQPADPEQSVHLAPLPLSPHTPAWQERSQPDPPAIDALPHLLLDEPLAAVASDTSVVPCAAENVERTASLVVDSVPMECAPEHESENAGEPREHRDSLFGVKVARNSALELLNMWNNIPSQMSRRTSTIDQQKINDSFQHRQETFFALVVVHPSSWLRFIWDIIMVAAVVHDFIMIPLRMLRLVQTACIAAMAWTVRLYWSCNVVMAIVSGYHRPDGTVENRIPQIVRRYISHEMLLDIALLSIAWAELAIEPSSGLILEGLQWLRMLRVLWLRRIQLIMESFLDRAHSEIIVVMVGIAEIMLIILAVMHVMSCLWIGVGRSDWTGWVAGLDVDESDSVSQYILSFHWTMAKLHGDMEQGPGNKLERMFTIGSLLGGFVTAAAFVAALSSSMARLYTVVSQESTRLKVLSRYLHEHNISDALCRRIKGAIKEAMVDQQGDVKESHVELLQLLSEPLRAEIHFERHGQVLLGHPLFKRLLFDNPASLKQMCHTAVSTMRLTRGDVLFCQGEAPRHPRLILVCQGSLSYTQDGTDFVSVGQGDWLCEHVLWTNWVYQGMLVACDRCRVTMVDAVIFQQIASTSLWKSLNLREYARLFLASVEREGASASDIGEWTVCRNLVKRAGGVGGEDETVPSSDRREDSLRAKASFRKSWSAGRTAVEGRQRRVCFLSKGAGSE